VVIAALQVRQLTTLVAAIPLLFTKRGDRHVGTQLLLLPHRSTAQQQLSVGARPHERTHGSLLFYACEHGAEPPVHVAWAHCHLFPAQPCDALHPAKQQHNVVVTQVMRKRCFKPGHVTPEHKLRQVPVHHMLVQLHARSFPAKPAQNDVPQANPQQSASTSLAGACTCAVVQHASCKSVGPYCCGQLTSC
jgi:hypothetical protein